MFEVVGGLELLGIAFRGVFSPLVMLKLFMSAMPAYFDILSKGRVKRREGDLAWAAIAAAIALSSDVLYFDKTSCGSFSGESAIAEG